MEERRKSKCVHYVVGTKSHSSGPEIHGKTKKSAENSEWHVDKHN